MTGETRPITVISHTMMLALLVFGVELMWISMSYFTIAFVDIGISHAMMQVVSCSLSVVAMCLSLASMRSSAMRFTMIVFFWSLTCFVTNMTSLINGEEGKEVVFGVFMIAVSCFAFFRNKEGFLTIGSFLILIELVLMWLGVSNPEITVVFTFGLSGTIFAYCACGYFIYLDLGKDYLHVVTPSMVDESTFMDSGNLYETISNAMFGILLFVAGLHLLERNIVHQDCVPLAIISLIIVAVSFFGMNRGYIPEGVTHLILAIYFLCQAITVFALDISVLGLLAFVCVIPLFVVLAMYRRRRDTVKMTTTGLLILFFAIIALFDYNQAVGAILLIISSLSTYCAMCRMIFAEFGYTLPLYKYL